jgi:hypothetical protein
VLEPKRVVVVAAAAAAAAADTGKHSTLEEIPLACRGVSSERLTSPLTVPDPPAETPVSTAVSGPYSHGGSQRFNPLTSTPP